MTRWPLFVVSLGFGLVLTYPYLSLDSANSRLAVSGGLQYSVLVVHIFTAAVALVLGPLQFMPRVRARRRLLVQVPFGGGEAGSIGDRASSMIPIGQTLGWIINLIVVEYLLRRSYRTRPER